MTQEQISQFIAANGDKFDQANIGQIKSMLEQVNENRANEIMSANFKSPMTMLIIAWLLGGWGVDRFMLGQTGLGVAKLLTLGGCGVWALIDIFTAMGRARAYNMQLLQKLL